MKKALLIATVLLFVTVPAWADSTYTYTGQPLNEGWGFSCLSGGGSCGAVTGSFTVYSPLGAGAYHITNPESYSFTEESFTWDSSSSSIEFMDVALDASGNFVFWDIEIGSPTGSDWIQYKPNSSGFELCYNCIIGAPAGSGYDTVSYYPSDYPSSGYEYATNSSAGTWSGPPSAAVPEPASLILFGSGLAALAGMRRKRR